MATSDLIVSVSGIRGIVGDSLRAEDACRFAAALGSPHAGGRFLVGRDSRPSGEALKHAVAAGLLSAGCDVADLGIVPTPTVGVAVQTLKAQGAIQITASHNPAPWNGLKLFGADGAVLPPDAGAAVAARFRSGDFPRAAWDATGRVSIPPDVLADHRERVRDAVSVAEIAARRFRVFVDANGGAGGPLACELLAELGCEVVQHACEPTGEFLHPPEPLVENLVDVAPWVTHNRCDIGFVLDPDADRLAVIDGDGVCLSEELTLAMCLDYQLLTTPGPVVINMSTSRVNEDVAARHGAMLYRSAVGEANVVAKMREFGATIGGEGNGGVIDPRIGWVRDPFIGMAMVLHAMARRHATVAELARSLPQYHMTKAKVTVARPQLAAVLAALPGRWPEARVDTTDGTRLEGGDWWLQVRASNTEPVVRVIAESPTAEQTARLVDEVKSLIESHG